MAPRPCTRTALLTVFATVVGITGLHFYGAAAVRDTNTDATVQIIPLGTAEAGTPDSSRAAELTDMGYSESEFLMSGTAQLYSGPSGDRATGTGQRQSYTTRLLVRAPKSPARFSGRVMVEPFNTSGSHDVDAAWGMIGSRLTANGDAWIGVTVRHLSVSALKSSDGVRYASMNIPLNGQAWDMLTHIAQLVRSRTQANPLRTLRVKRVYMTGYSQSAIDTVTYANAINPLATRSGERFLYDGYLIMGRSGSATPVDSGSADLPKFEIRPVGKATSPIVDVESQTDVQGFSDPAYTSAGSASVRRADSDARDDRYRLYEIPGAAHAAKIPSCDHQGTTFPLQYFERAALAKLYAWVERGAAPPREPRIETTAIGTVSTLALDENGNAKGGVRSPFLDRALARYEAHDTPGPLCALAGAEVPLDVATLHTRYASVNDYMQAFTERLDRAIKKRTLLHADRSAILAEARRKADPILANS